MKEPIDEHCPTELPMTEMFYFCTDQLSNHQPCEHSNVANATEEINVLLYLILINFHLDSCMWLRVILLNRVVKEPYEVSTHH